MNTVGNLLTAYFNLLNGQTGTLTVHKLTVPENIKDNYVWIYPEGGNENNTKTSKNDIIIIRIDVITSFQNDADQTLVEDIDTIINELIIPTPGNTGLTPPAGLQYIDVTRENYQYLIERDGAGVVYRKISRYSQRVHQT